ncbi:MAG: hypothetical protein HGA39_06435 [Coriobacteriia bacterium]|nr:hypothetical protein [Coriobacteriia bacterium]
MKNDRYPDDDVFPRGQRPTDEKLDREGAVFMEPDSRKIGCDDDESSCAPDDFFEDPYADNATGVPGTVDDIPLSFGTITPAPDDAHLVEEGATHQTGRAAPAEEPEGEVGKRDERELWAEQKALIAEDEITGLKLKNFPEEHIAEILEAMGDDAADPLQESPNGTSATGAWGAPEHGGFPERKD